MKWSLVAAAILVMILVLVAAVPNARELSPRVTPIALKNISGMAWDGEKLWITVDGEGAIYRVDAASGSIERRLPFPSRETAGSAWDGKALWQISYKARTISRVDPASGKITAVIATPGNGGCSGMTYDGRHLWIANYDTELIYAVDPRNGKIVGQIAGNGHATGLAWDAGRLWTGFVLPSNSPAATPRIGFVQEIDVRSQLPIRAIPIAGVFAGTSDATPASPRATRMWWYDGYHERVVEIRLGRGHRLSPRGS